MREIKFRAWDSENKKMVNVHAIDWLDSDNSRPTSINYPHGKLYDAPEDFGGAIKLMQYTGLKDKNGTDIYESDIVDGGKYGKGKIIWRGSGWMIEYYDKNQYLKYDYLSLAVKDPIEVTGNIYEN